LAVIGRGSAATSSKRIPYWSCACQGARLSPGSSSSATRTTATIAEHAIACSIRVSRLIWWFLLIVQRVAVGAAGETIAGGHASPPIRYESAWPTRSCGKHPRPSRRRRRAAIRRYGIDPYGEDLGPWGGPGLITLRGVLLAAQNRFIVVFDQPPLARDPKGWRDATNTRNYTIEPIDPTITINGISVIPDKAVVPTRRIALARARQDREDPRQRHVLGARSAPGGDGPRPALRPVPRPGRRRHPGQRRRPARRPARCRRRSSRGST